MDNTPDSPAKTPGGYTTQGGNYWTLITPEIWKVLHAVLHYNSINSGGYSGLSSAAKSLRDASKIYNCEDRTGDAQIACQSILNNNSQTQANLNNALDLVQQRTSQIQSLQSQINSTSDPKAIAELQARIQSENTQVSNDANRIALMQATAATQQQAAQQQQKERELKWLSQSGDGTQGFHFSIQK